MRRSTDVEEDTLSGSFLGFGAASKGSGFCRVGGIARSRWLIASAFENVAGVRVQLDRIAE